jgi:hypothetical protein
VKFPAPKLLLISLLSFAFASHAQIDPEKRQLIQLGYNQPLQGRGPISGYAFYYLNHPQFLRTNLTLRLAVAPVYLDAELGISQALGERTDLGIGAGGGGFADSYSEVRLGRFLKDESFTGHSGEISASMYHLFNPGQQVPLFAIVRGMLHQSIYERESQTLPGFVLPNDQMTYHLRAGVRWGGREPLMDPKLAFELSAWYESQFRGDPGFYGLGGDRRVQANSHLYWGRALFIYTLPESRHTFSVNVTLGGSVNADRFSAYRLGAVLPLVSEFPLNLPGYYYQEISAKRFALVGSYYSLPIMDSQQWRFTATVTTALVDYAPGLAQPGDCHTGLGCGIGYTSPGEDWQVLVGYAYGVDAIRSQGRGAHSVGILCQFDLGARQRLKAAAPDHDLTPKSRGLFRLFQMFR